MSKYLNSLLESPMPEQPGKSSLQEQFIKQAYENPNSAIALFNLAPTICPVCGSEYVFRLNDKGRLSCQFCLHVFIERQIFVA